MDFYQGFSFLCQFCKHCWEARAPPSRKLQALHCSWEGAVEAWSQYIHSAIRAQENDCWKGPRSLKRGGETCLGLWRCRNLSNTEARRLDRVIQARALSPGPLGAAVQETEPQSSVRASTPVAKELELYPTLSQEPTNHLHRRRHPFHSLWGHTVGA